jgi:alpha-mannosidase
VPMLQVGRIGTDAIVTGWWRHTAPSGTLWSYVMNNYWETNYRASQGGVHEWRYALRLHDGFDSAAADRWGREVAQPLIAAVVGRQRPLPAVPFSLEAARAVLTGVERVPGSRALVVRLFNPGDGADTVVVRLRDAAAAVAIGDSRTAEGDPLTGPLVLPPRGLVSLRIRPADVEPR